LATTKEKRQISQLSRAFGRNLNKLMLEQSLSFKALSAITGVSDAALCRYVNGQNEVPLRVAGRICKHFDVTIEDMVRSENSDL